MRVINFYSEDLKIDYLTAFGTRTGNYFLRVYSPDNTSLKFELEIKKYKATGTIFN